MNRAYLEFLTKPCPHSMGQVNPTEPIHGLWAGCAVCVKGRVLNQDGRKLLKLLMLFRKAFK